MSTTMQNDYVLDGELDGEPVSFTQLIKAARQIEDDGSHLYYTSWAASVLGANGHTVEAAEEAKT